MKPKIQATQFGAITVTGETYEYDILISLDGSVKKRKKKLSKEIYGTSHIISLGEAEYTFESGAERLIIGSGQSGMVQLSPEAAQFFVDEHCQVDLLPTPAAIQNWNQADGKVIGLFHITC